MKLPKIERYNQIVWAVVGTGVIGMALVGILVGMAAFVGSMFTDYDGLPIAVMDEDLPESGERKTLQYDFCLPIPVYGSPYQLIRIASDKLVVRKVEMKRKSKPKAYESVNSFNGYSPGYERCGGNKKGVVNVLVRNADTGDMRLALDESAMIYTLDYPSERSSHTVYSDDFPPVGLLFWEIAFVDSNLDGVIDELDDVGAYLSDADGRNLKRITPAMSRVLSKTYDKSRNILLMSVLRDTNGDGNLDDEDSTSLVESSVNRRVMVREILDKERLSNLMRGAEPKQKMISSSEDSRM